MSNAKESKISTKESHVDEDDIDLPEVVNKRVKALKKIQYDLTKLEVEFFKEIHALDYKYHNLQVPMFEKRATIVQGDYEPTDDESEWHSVDEDEADPDPKNKSKMDELKDVQGIPDFWLIIFKNVRILREMIQPYDEPILKHLKDVKLITSNDPISFLLEFHFGPNDYFTNEILSKEYLMKCEVDNDDPFDFEGIEVYKCIGCTINWIDGKDITSKTVRKKQKHKGRGPVRVITEVVQKDSFFNFFSPPMIPENSSKIEDLDEIQKNLLNNDIEIGQYIIERIIPRAVLYYTGDCVDEDDFTEEEDDDDDEEGEEDLEGRDKGSSKEQKSQKCSP